MSSSRRGEAADSAVDPGVGAGWTCRAAGERAARGLHVRGRHAGPRGGLADGACPRGGERRAELANALVPEVRLELEAALDQRFERRRRVDGDCAERRWLGFEQREGDLARVL